jgi:type I restriction enzyme S subunit
LAIWSDPNGWSVYPFNEVIGIDAPLVDPKKSQYMGLLHYGPDRIEKDTGRLLPALTAEQDGLISHKFLCNKNHILYSKIRPYLNKVALSEELCLCSADVYPISTNPEVADRIYVWHLLRSKAFLKYAASHSNRANIPKINREQLLGFQAPIPPLALQREFSQQMDRARWAATRSASSDMATNSLFFSLQSLAFSGELG